jgi:hypothetical protein
MTKKIPILVSASFGCLILMIVDQLVMSSRNVLNYGYPIELAFSFIGKNDSLTAFTSQNTTSSESEFSILQNVSTVSGFSVLRKEEESSGFSLPPYIFFILLALQCGCQPLLTKKFMPTTVVRSTAILAQEGAKLVISVAYLAASGNWWEATKDWTLKSAALAAGFPAGLFVVQSYCNLMAVQVLPPMVFVVLNQTKTLSTAWCCFLLMGQKQSELQVMALILLVFATLIIQRIIPMKDPCQKKADEKTELQGKDSSAEEMSLLEESDLGTDENSSEEPKGDLEARNGEIQEKERKLLDQDDMDDENENGKAEQVESKKDDAAQDEAALQLTMGVLPALFASLLSGLAGVLVQRTLQFHERSPYLFNVELALFSSSFLLTSLIAGSPDCRKIKEHGVSQGWNWKTWIPVVVNAFGAILVGLVTKYQGAVVKGFAMIFGMAISGVLQQLTLGNKGGGVTMEQFVGGCLGALSLWMHASFPPTKP